MDSKIKECIFTPLHIHGEIPDIVMHLLCNERDLGYKPALVTELPLITLFMWLGYVMLSFQMCFCVFVCVKVCLFVQRNSKSRS